MSSNFERCIEDRKLVPFKATSEMIEKEINSASYDLTQAQNSYNNGDIKWATIQGYCAMFHAVRALIYKRGYREKSHRCLLIALQESYVDTGLLSATYVDSFREAMDLREDADYGFIYDSRSAKNIITAAKEFYTNVKKFLNKKAQ
ncbi:HEPN domain-containing protein [candidate division WOR-3 bacterium]|nr:HEPN domain-containing protein [candidate division WOR-3 bacterium]